MSGILLFIVAVVLLGVAIYSPSPMSRIGAPHSCQLIRKEIIHPHYSYLLPLLFLPDRLISNENDKEGRLAGLPLCLN